MPIEITDVDGGLGNIIMMTGVITESEFVEAYQEHLSQDEEKFRRYRFSLTEIIDVTDLNLSAAVIQEHARTCAVSAELNPDAVIAVVAQDDVGFGLSRMWQILSDETTWEISVFRDNKEARNWIRERVEDRWNITDLTME